MAHKHSIRGISELQLGEHLGFFYETEEEHRAVLTSFLRRGLENREKVFYIVDIRSVRTILDYLRADGLEVERYQNCGQLVVVNSSDVYLREDEFDPSKMLHLLRSQTQLALDQGFKGFRSTSEMTWVLRGYPGSEDLLGYETSLNDLIADSSCLFVCQYDLRHFTSALLIHVLATHPAAIVGGIVHRNNHYMPPPEFLGSEYPPALLRQWLEQLGACSGDEEVPKAIRPSAS